MRKLFSRLALVYHEMYQTIFDYRKQFQFYHARLKRYRCTKILEIGCGSGNLAPFFLERSYDYTGLDLSPDMLAIAKKIAPHAHFVKGDMRKLRYKRCFDAILITGRSFTYMTTNKDAMRALQSVHQALRPGGMLIFDNLDATHIFSHFKPRSLLTARYGATRYSRESRNDWNLETGWTWNWHAVYAITENKKRTVIKDDSVLRAFTEDELRLFLVINRFRCLDVIKEGKVITIVAKRE